MGDYAFIFPGQGSQSVGMLAEAGEAWPLIGDTFAEASEAIGVDLWDLAANGPAEAQALTANTQPLILTASVALYRAWLQAGGAKPAVAAGHSLGEFSALVAAESLALTDAVALVRKRGQAMQAAVPVGEGAMAAIIGLEDNVINDICAAESRGSDHLVLAVNYNSPGQVVIAGHTPAVDAASDALKAAGARRALPLPVSAPFHTPLMTAAGDVLAGALNELDVADPIFPVISNVNAQAQTRGDAIRELLVKQIAAPVLWTGGMQTMVEQGVSQFIECGPGKVLAGLVRRIDKTLSAFTIETPASLSETLGAIGSE